ncbi:hypothetical protein JCM33374_g3437 [Metschnikowia sp. JCM 33374]|nr:hypothetical protein JCM33374_g3437 [Metschnikowia sp. JCM 33374]
MKSLWDNDSTGDVLRDILYIFIRAQEGLQGSEYATIYATIPTVHSLLKKLNDMNKDTVRVSHTTISSGLTAAHDKLYTYYPIFNEDCEGMEILYIATVLHSKYKLNYFRTRDLFPPALIDCIKTKLENLFKLYEIYYARLKLKRNKLYPAMTKMVAVVKDKVRRISPGDDESGVDSDNEMIEDKAELSGQLQREMNDSSDENSEEGESGSTRIS